MIKFPVSPRLIVSVSTEEGERMTDHQTIKFSDIPRTTQLYKDFLYDFNRVSNFYQPEGLDIASHGESAYEN